MFCYQCEQTKQGQGCQVLGVCGKDENSASLQDLLIHALKGISQYAHRAAQLGARNPEMRSSSQLKPSSQPLPTSTSTSIRWLRWSTKPQPSATAPGPSIKRPRPRPASPRKPSPDRLASNRRKSAKLLLAGASAGWIDISFANNGKELKNLEELVIYGLKGVAAYAYHAMVLGSERSRPATPLIHELLNGLTEKHTAERAARQGAAGRRDQSQGHGAARRGEHRRVRPSGADRGARHAGQGQGDRRLRARPQGPGGAAQADRGNGDQHLHARRDAPGARLSGAEEVQAPRRELRRRLAGAAQGILRIPRRDPDDHQLPHEAAEGVPGPALHRAAWSAGPAWRTSPTATSSR